jgi:altronate dehydratase
VQAKVRSLVDECKALRETLDRFLRAKNARSQADHERAKLFAGATSGSSSVRSSLPPVPLSHSPADLCARQGLQNLLAESTSLSSSNRMLADLEQVGANIVASLVTQNEMIKRAHQRVLDMGHSMG